MQSFRTEFPRKKSLYSISHSDKIFCMGSCFAENISTKLNERAFHTVNSPFGIVFNPLSMADQLNRIIHLKKYEINDLIFDQGMYHSLDHHGAYSGQDANQVLNKINDELFTAHDFMNKATFVILTMGSSHYYRFLLNNKIAANCHKIPSVQFQKSVSSVERIVDSMSDAMHNLKLYNPGIHLIISVSPVRYLRDGFIENSKSKASLILASHSLVEKFNWVEYFPAYEIFMDDLRDYRFAAMDLIHPNESAIQYIWQYFSNLYFEPGTEELIKKVMQVQQMRRHKFIHKDTESSQGTIKKMEQLIEILLAENPELKDRLV